MLTRINRHAKFKHNACRSRVLFSYRKSVLKIMKRNVASRNKITRETGRQFAALPLATCEKISKTDAILAKNARFFWIFRSFCKKFGFCEDFLLATLWYGKKIPHKNALDGIKISVWQSFTVVFLARIVRVYGRASWPLCRHFRAFENWTLSLNCLVK